MVRNPSVDENGMRKGAWSEEEDNKLKAYILRYGHWNWRQLPKFAGLARCGKSCRLRWLNYLKPGLKKGSYSKEEEEMIITLHQELGNKWSFIAAKLPGRTDNEIKNYWNAHFKKAKKQDPEPTEKTNRLSQNINVMDHKDQNSSLSLSKTSDQEIESDTAIAAADASTQEPSYNFSTILDGAENSFSSDQESYPKFFESFWTEPFYYPTTSSDQIPSSISSLALEDWFTENEIYSEQSFVKTFDNLSVETVFSSTSSNLGSPSERCNNSIVTHSGEASADTFEGVPSEPFCIVIPRKH